MQFGCPRVRPQRREMRTCNLLGVAGFDGIDARSKRMREKDLRSFGRERSVMKGPRQCDT